MTGEKASEYMDKTCRWNKEPFVAARPRLGHSWGKRAAHASDVEVLVLSREGKLRE